MEPGTQARPAPEPKLCVGQVYRDHAAFVWRVIRRLGIADGAAEDVMHEVFLVVHRRLGEYDGRAALTTWLFHLARGVASNHRRGLSREQARMERFGRGASGARPTPDQHVECGEAATFVREFLAGLDPARREIFELVELDGFSVPDVAEMLGINVNTAYSRLRLARKAFARASEAFRTPPKRFG